MECCCRTVFETGEEAAAAAAEATTAADAAGLGCRGWRVGSVRVWLKSTGWSEEGIKCVGGRGGGGVTRFGAFGC